jgi:hypothetical protein
MLYREKTWRQEEAVGWRSDRKVDEGGQGKSKQWSPFHWQLIKVELKQRVRRKKNRSKKFRLALLQPGSNIDGSLHLGKVFFFRIKLICDWFQSAKHLSVLQNLKTTYDAFDYDLLILDRCHSKPLGLEKFKYMKNSVLCVLWPKWIKTLLYLQDFWTF